MASSSLSLSTIFAPVVLLMWVGGLFVQPAPASAQDDYATFETRGNFIVDYPQGWIVRNGRDANTVLFSSAESTYGLLNIQAFGLHDDASVIVRDLIQANEKNDSDVTFADPVTLSLVDVTHAAQATGSNPDSLTEPQVNVLIAAEVRGVGVYLLASIPQRDREAVLEQIYNIILSIRRTGDPQPPRYDSGDPHLIGSGSTSLDLDSLTRARQSTVGNYEFAYPPGWSIRSVGRDILFSQQTGMPVFGFLTIVPLGTDSRFRATTPAAILAEDNAGSGEVFGEIMAFNLNGLAAARTYREDAGTRTVKMVALRHDRAIILRATANITDLPQLEPLLRGMVFTARPIGAPLAAAVGLPSQFGFEEAYPYSLDITGTTNHAP